MKGVNLTSIIESIFGTSKPIIGMVHLLPLPGSPRYESTVGIDDIVKRALDDAIALEEGGVDGLLFSNESDAPFLFKVGPETVASVTYVVARVIERVKLPFGVDILWDPYATIAVAKAVNAKFVRAIMAGVYASDLGLINTEGASVMRYRKYIGADHVKVFIYLNPEFASSLSNRPLDVIAKTIKWLSLADAYCVSGIMPGEPPRIEDIVKVRQAVRDIPILANTGMNPDNIEKYLPIVDGAIVGTAFKKDSVTLNPVDKERVKKFMEKVKRLRSEIE